MSRYKELFKIVFVCVLFATNVMAKTYYIGPDAVATSPDVAITDLYSRTNPVYVNAGDSVLFQAGETIRGHLDIYVNLSSGAGTVTVGIWQTQGSTAQYAWLRNSQSLSGLSKSFTSEPNPKGPDGTTTITHLQNQGIYKVDLTGTEFANGVVGLVYNSVMQCLPTWPQPVAADVGVPREQDYVTVDDFYEVGDYDYIDINESEAPNALHTYGVGQTAAITRICNWGFKNNDIDSLVDPNDTTDNRIKLVGSLRADYNGNDLPADGMGTILINHPAWLGQKRFYFNPTTNILYFKKDGGGQPDASLTDLIEDTDDDILYMDGRDRNVSFDISNLRMYNSATDGIHVCNANDVTIDDVQIYRCLMNGINLYDNTGDVMINDCVVQYTGACGINNYNLDGKITVKNSTIRDNGNFYNQSIIAMNLCGIRACNYGQILVDNNTFINAGAACLDLGGGADVGMLIEDNLFQNWDRMLNDFGAIYLNGSTQTLFSRSNQTIRYNDFKWGTGNTKGTLSTISYSAGVYLDWKYESVSVQYNDFQYSNSKIGAIMINGGVDNMVRDNDIQTNYGPCVCYGVMPDPIEEPNDNYSQDNTFTCNDSSSAIIRFSDWYSATKSGSEDLFDSWKTVFENQGNSFNKSWKYEGQWKGESL